MSQTLVRLLFVRSLLVWSFLGICSQQEKRSVSPQSFSPTGENCQSSREWITARSSVKGFSLCLPPISASYLTQTSLHTLSCTLSLTSNSNQKPSTHTKVALILHFHSWSCFSFFLLLWVSALNSTVPNFMYDLFLSLHRHISKNNWQSRVYWNSTYLHLLCI